MAEIISINGKCLVFGLTWITIANPKMEKAEIAAFLRKTKAKQVVRHCGSEIKYGLIRQGPELDESQRREPLLSAAMLFSDQRSKEVATENSLLIQRLDEQKVAVIVLLKGAPYLDMVLANSELDEQLAEIRNEGHAELVAYGNLHGYVAEKMTLEMLLCGNTSNCELHQFKNTAHGLQRYAVLLALLALAAGYALWEWVKVGQQKELSQKAADPALIYEASLQKLLASANFNADAALKTIWSVVRNREIEMAGWTLQSMRCTSAQCEERWQQGNGSYASLKQKVQSGQTISLQANNVTSIIQTPLDGKKTALHRADLPEKNALWADLISQQQRMKRIHPSLIFTPKAAKVIGQPGAALTSVTQVPVAASVPAGLIVVAGDMTVDAPIGFATEIIQRHLDHIMISEILIEAPGDVKNARIKIKGNYYAKS